MKKYFFNSILSLVLVQFYSCAKQGNLLDNSLVKTIDTKQLCAIDRYGKQVFEDHVSLEVEGFYEESIVEDGVQASRLIYSVVKDNGDSFELTEALIAPRYSRVKVKLQPIPMFLACQRFLISLLNTARCKYLLLIPLMKTFHF